MWLTATWNHMASSAKEVGERVEDLWKHNGLVSVTTHLIVSFTQPLHALLKHHDLLHEG